MDGLAGISATGRVTRYLQLLATELGEVIATPSAGTRSPRYDRTYRDSLARGPALLVSPGRVFLLGGQSIGIRQRVRTPWGSLASEFGCASRPGSSSYSRRTRKRSG